MAAPVGISIQFDRPMSVIARKNFRVSGVSARARSSMNGSISKKPIKTSDDASTTCSTMVRSFRRKVMAPAASISERTRAAG